MDADISYAWHEASVPSRLDVVKVHGFLVCPDTGRVLVQEYGGCFNLPGGSPEAVDASWSATLVREAGEESQIEVSGVAYLGYQEVRQPGREPCAQVRMVGLIDRFRPRCPDPDSGRLLRRLMCPLAGAGAVLGWGPVMDGQVAAAGRVAGQLWRVRVSAPAPAGYVD